MSLLTPLVAGSGLASTSGLEGVGVAAVTLGDASLFARFFFADLDSTCVGGLLATGEADMTAMMVCVRECMVYVCVCEQPVQSQVKQL
jgi:hypothetical protein